MPPKKLKLVHRIPDSNIYIDYWKPSITEEEFRFMTSLRIDDENAIEAISQSTYTIYTSKFNKWYLTKYHKVSEHRLFALPLNTTIPICNKQGNEKFSVTTFDANYHAGSSMFFFQGPFGNIFFTGFFRPSPTINIFNNPVLKSIIERKLIHTAYVDNTYAAEHCLFPPRNAVMDDIITFLRTNLSFKVGISGKRLGKEEVLVDLAKYLNEQISVTETKFEILSQLKVQEYFTIQKNTRIEAFDKVLSRTECFKKQAEHGPYVVILLTASYTCWPTYSDVRNVKIFPYSSHCNHLELLDFVSKLNPRNLIPIIKTNEMNSLKTIIPKSIYDVCFQPSSSPEYHDACDELMESDNYPFYSCPERQESLDEDFIKYMECDAQADISTYNDSDDNEPVLVDEKLESCMNEASCIETNIEIVPEQTSSTIINQRNVENVVDLKSHEKSMCSKSTASTVSVVPQNYCPENDENVISSTNYDYTSLVKEAKNCLESENMVLTQCNDSTEIRNEFTSQKIIEVPSKNTQFNFKTFADKAVETDLNQGIINEISNKLRFNSFKYVDQDSLYIAQHISKNPKSIFDSDSFYQNLIQLSSKSLTICSGNCISGNCSRCKRKNELEKRKRERKAINVTLYRFLNTERLKKSISCVNKWSVINGDAVLSHPIYSHLKDF